MVLMESVKQQDNPNLNEKAISPKGAFFFFLINVSFIKAQASQGIESCVQNIMIFMINTELT